MAKIFQKIRKTLLSEHKFTKYLLYAVGEIILVVIGILIALQINTWNNERLQKNKEQGYLIEIKQNLEKDTTSINQVIQFYHRKANLIDESFQLFELGQTGEPYINHFLPKMDTLTSFEAFVPVRTAFDNMVAAESIDLIQNKELRTALSQFYSQLEFQSGTEERAKEATRMFTDIIGPKMMTKEVIQFYLKRNTAYPSIAEVNIHQDQEVASRLFTMYMNSRTMGGELRNLKDEITAILHLIDQNIVDE